MQYSFTTSFQTENMFPNGPVYAKNPETIRDAKFKSCSVVLYSTEYETV